MDYKRGFQEMLLMSNSECGNIQRILMEVIPSILSVEKSTLEEDKKGTDYWAILPNGDKLSIDCKIRAEDCVDKWGADDLALEDWSIVPEEDWKFTEDPDYPDPNITEKIGWTLDANKRTDYILWFWKDSKRWCMIPFIQLCFVFREHWYIWKYTYKDAYQQQRGSRYYSHCIFVPRDVVLGAIYDHFGGKSNYL